MLQKVYTHPHATQIQMANVGPGYNHDTSTKVNDIYNTCARGIGFVNVLFSGPLPPSSRSIPQFYNKFGPTHLIQVCRPRGRCGSCRPCSPGRRSGARACWRHPGGSSWPYRDGGDSSCGAGSPETRGVEPKTFGGTVEGRHGQTIHDGEIRETLYSNFRLMSE